MKLTIIHNPAFTQKEILRRWGLFEGIMKRLSVIVAVIHPSINVSYGTEYWAKTYWVHISIILKEVL